MTNSPSLDTDDLVTVTIAHDGETHDFHGVFVRTEPVLTMPRKDGDRYIHIPMTSGGYTSTAAHLPKARPWVKIASATGGGWTSSPWALPAPGLPGTGPDYEFSGHNLWVDTQSPNITLTPVTTTGREWVEANMTPVRRKDALLARFAEFDPEAAKRLGTLIEDLLDEQRHNAYDQGYSDGANR